MKVITKIDGIDLLKMIANDELECGTMIRHKRDDLILTANPPKPVYEYYKYTAGDKRFHRCDENGKLGAKGQSRFINYSTLNKIFEIVEIDKEFEMYRVGECAIYQSADSISIRPIIEENKDIEKLKIEQDGSTYYIKNEHGTKCYLTKHSYLIADKVNELIDEVKKLKGKYE